MPHRSAVALLALVLLSAALLAQPSPPSMPAWPSPPSGATGVAVDVTLSWASDPNAKKYEIYLGTTSPLPLVGTTSGTPSYKPATLASGTTYCSRVCTRRAIESVAALRSNQRLGHCRIELGACRKRHRLRRRVRLHGVPALSFR